MGPLKVVLATALFAAAAALYAADAPPTEVATPPHRLIPVPPPAGVAAEQLGTEAGAASKPEASRAVMKPHPQCAGSPARRSCRHAASSRSHGGPKAGATK